MSFLRTTIGTMIIYSAAIIQWESNYYILPISILLCAIGIIVIKEEITMKDIKLLFAKQEKAE